MKADGVPSDSESEVADAGPLPLASDAQVLRVGVLVQLASPPRIYMPWEQGVFQDLFRTSSLLSTDLPVPCMEVMASSSSIVLTEWAKVPADGDARRTISHFRTALLQMSAHLSWKSISGLRLTTC